MKEGVLSFYYFYLYTIAVVNYFNSIWGLQWVGLYASPSYLYSYLKCFDSLVLIPSIDEGIIQILNPLYIILLAEVHHLLNRTLEAQRIGGVCECCVKI